MRHPNKTLLWRGFCNDVWHFYRNFTARSVLWRIVTLLWRCCVYWKANIDNNIVLLPKSFFSSYTFFSKPTSIILCTTLKGHYFIKKSSFEFILDPNLTFLWLLVFLFDRMPLSLSSSSHLHHLHTHPLCCFLRIPTF